MAAEDRINKIVKWCLLVTLSVIVAALCLGMSNVSASGMRQSPVGQETVTTPPPAQDFVREAPVSAGLKARCRVIIDR